MTTLSKFIAIAALSGVAGFSGNAARASDEQGNFALRGYGGRTCETYIGQIQDAGHAANYGSWLMGYATARNRLQAETFDILPFPDGMVFLRAVLAVCRDQPKLTVEQAAHEVVAATEPLQQSVSSEIVTITHDGRSIQIRQRALASLQDRLSKRGLYSGPTDGRWNDDTALAVREFQLREKILASGLPDFTTLLRALLN